MRWPLLLFIGWFSIFPQATFFPQAVGADDPGDPHGSSPSASPPDSIPRPLLLQQNSAAHFYLALGRLQLDPVRYRKGSQTLLRTAAASASSASQDASYAEAGATVTETLDVNSLRGNATIHYSLICGSSRIAIDANARGPWRIEAQKGDGSSQTRVIVQQRPGKPMVLQHIAHHSERTIEALTWLHFREADPAVFSEFLEPILDEMLWPYRFAELAEDAQRQSLQPVGNSPIQDATLAAWIDQLRSPSRATRMMADRKLRSLGISLLPRLASIDATRLDTEQRHRLDQIQERLQLRAEDNAATLATLIRDDVHYWQLAGRRLDPSDQLLVEARFRHLEGLAPADAGTDSPRIASGSSSTVR